MDGLAWSLPISSLWEAWVEDFLQNLARRLGAKLSTAREGSTRRPLIWRTTTHSLQHLAPDFLLEWPNRAVWVDAKYKDHLERLRRDPWERLGDDLRDSHRADLHQVLAYGLLSGVEEVSTVLLYPEFQGRGHSPISTAELATGKRNVRLMLGALPFGFVGPAEEQASFLAWEQALSRSQ